MVKSAKSHDSDDDEFDDVLARHTSSSLNGTTFCFCFFVAFGVLVVLGFELFWCAWQ